MRKLEMALPQCKSEVPDELPPTEQCSEERDGNATVKDRTIVQKKVINESDPTTQPQSSSAVATAGRQSAQIYSVGKVDVRGRKVAKASGKRALAEETECNVGTSGAKTNGVSRTATVRDELVRNKRKPKFVMHIIQGNIEQSRSKAEKASMENFDYGDDEPIDLSIKSRQGQVLDKQSDDAMSNGQHCDENCDEQSSGKMDSSENATPSSEETCNKHELTEASQRYRNRTLSSFTPEEQEEIRRKASRIDEGAKFDSFDEFEECLEAYKVAWNYPFRRASSEHLRDGEGRVITRFKYKYIVFHCAHYGLPRKRGDGKRPNQNYLPLGCEARFRLNSDTTNGYLRISSFHKEHKNHGSTEEDYLRVVNKKRRNMTGKFMGSKIDYKVMVDLQLVVNQ
ncbi:unnamed protein product [Litomosoides sigmodontis]|uniref:ZSWIM3 N-terminal domain-containing protein n=1 Tax=Litomosoides sigmodontis TaxID=42156 RepID=A0A3P6TQT8_LITSI|nr:unnamed protein product [Litomosoides sigmodontis]